MSTARTGTTTERGITMKFGLVAHRLHRLGPDSGLIRWARTCESGLHALYMRLHATGGAHDALASKNMLAGLMLPLGNGRDGGLMRLVSRTAGGLNPQDALDGVFFSGGPGRSHIGLP